MQDDPRPRAVAMIARCVAAAMGSDRVAVAPLVAACRTVPALREVTGPEIGRLLKGNVDWRASQWREGGERVRGFIFRVTEKTPARAPRTVARASLTEKTQSEASNP